MAEQNSSKTSSHFRGPSLGHGWEEAGGEFYQEAFRDSISSDGDKTRESSWQNMLPSKRVTTVDTRTWGRTTRRHHPAASHHKSISTGIELEMETMPDLADNIGNEEETWDQLQQIRSLPVNMTTKRELKSNLLHTPTFRLHGLAALQLRRRQAWQTFKHLSMQMLQKLAPWQSTLRSIEANFGTGVASYFLLIRWLLLLNVFICLLLSLFVIIPWEIGQHSCYNLWSGNSSFPFLDGCHSYGNDSTDPVNRTDKCWFNYHTTVLDVIELHKNHPLLLLQDAVQGTGWLELTLSFYGYYHPAILIWGGSQLYNLALAYGLTVLFILVLCLISMTRSAAMGFKENINLGKMWLHRFSDIVFSSWDYCIDRAAVATTKKKAILQAVKVALAEEHHEKEKAARTTRTKIRLFMIRILVNVVVLGVLTLCGYIIYLVTMYSQNFIRDVGKSSEYTNRKSEQDDDDILVLLVEFLPSIVITALNFTVPKIFHYLVRFEYFSAVFEIKMSLVRSLFLRLSSLLVLVLTLYDSLKKNNQTKDCGDTAEGFRSKCWETDVGRQLYRLCIFDVVVTIVFTFLINFPVTLLCRRTCSRTNCLQCIAYPEFDLVGNTLDLIYSQSICWMGVFYSPILPFATAVKCFLIFYIKYFSLIFYCSPPARLYGASSSTSLFMNVLLLSFICCVLPIGYHITSLTPSLTCGPYRGLNTVWSIVSKEVSLLPEIIRDGFHFFGSAGFFAPAVLILIVFVYYYRSKAAANSELASSLKNQLVLEGQDKRFLLSRLLSASKQQQ